MYAVWCSFFYGTVILKHMMYEIASSNCFLSGSVHWAYLFMVIIKISFEMVRILAWFPAEEIKIIPFPTFDSLWKLISIIRMLRLANSLLYLIRCATYCIGDEIQFSTGIQATDSKHIQQCTTGAACAATSDEIQKDLPVWPRVCTWLCYCLWPADGRVS